eukprot:CAMPEP_0170170442 /NCGR_PEP_ID=MMETSP0040_2-20121228/3436_1 /TAXON_ID=641309 /ORGANISM="Lotharella oceanica, Strain CCMP622" /LENGTH=176 /DNA_ID=CAMNT_0010409847 /DNA_START=125 /DNA_END=652 /DNA_ORIENTATION=+
MQLKSKFPDALLQIHAGCAVAMLLMVLFQKHSVIRMLGKEGSFARQAHRWVGRLTLLVMMGMDVAGYLMGPYAQWDHFTTFEYLFAAPWIVFLAGIYSFASIKHVRLHRLFGNMLLKACIATPLARLAGAALQRSELATQKEWSDEMAYYIGIGGVSAVVGLWQACDALHVVVSYW